MKKIAWICVIAFGLLNVPLMGEVISNDRSPFSFSTYDDCTGEFVALDGVFHFLVSATTAGEGLFHYKWQINAHGRGAGMDTGNSYIWNDKLSDKEHGSYESFTYVSLNNTRLISHGPEPNLQAWWKHRLHCDLDGCEVLVDEFWTECKPRNLR